MKRRDFLKAAGAAAVAALAPIPEAVNQALASGGVLTSAPALGLAPGSFLPVKVWANLRRLRHDEFTVESKRGVIHLLEPLAARSSLSIEYPYRSGDE